MKTKIFSTIFIAAVMLEANSFCALRPTGLNNAASPFSDEYYAAQAIACLTDATCSGGSAGVTAPRMVAVGAAGRAYFSDDAVTWTPVNLTNDLNQTYVSAIWDGTHFVAVGFDSVAGVETALYSADGISWTAGVFGSNCGVPSILQSLAAGNGIIVAVGQASGGGAACVQYSTDNGRTWTQGTGAGTIYPSITFDGTNFVAADGPAVNATVFTSTDGMSFAAGGSPFTGGGNATITGTLARIASTNRILFLGTDGTTAGGITHAAVSTDSGASWTPAANSVFQGNGSSELPLAAADNGARLVAVGINCRVDFSDSLTIPFWNHGTAMSGCSSIDWSGLVFDGTHFVAVGTNISTMQGVIAVSPSGLPSDWSISALPQSVSDVNFLALRP